MITKQLITLLNSGRCLAFVGSGPSTAMGYPSWKQMAGFSVSFVKENEPGKFDAGVLSELIEEKRYPEVFDRVATALGGVSRLLPTLRTRLRSVLKSSDPYRFLVRWPFRCYFTTNYDDEIYTHLSATGEHFTKIGNSKADLTQLNDTSSRLIIKLHGDLTSEEGLVLTSRQYREFRMDGSRLYFREKLKAIISTLPIFLIG